MDKKRVVPLLLVLVAAVGGLKYKEVRDERERLALEARMKATGPPPKPVRKWRWPEEPEWVVHQVTREIVSWSLAGSSAPVTLSVRRKPDTNGLGAFDVTLTGLPAATAMVVQPQAHMWDPAGYVDAATRVLGPGPAESGEPVSGVSDLLLASDTASLRKADGLLLEALTARPRDPRLHEQAALLWAAHAMRESARGRVDPKPFLNGVVAHLAIARALALNRDPSADAAIAGLVIDVLLQRQTDAMKSLDTFATSFPGPANAVWADVLRVRVTSDPRRKASTAPAHRLEKLEYLRATGTTRQDCNIVMPIAKSWSLSPAADWSRESLRCFDGDYFANVGDPVVLQAEDAAKLSDVAGGSVEEIVVALVALSKAETHLPGKPTSIVPASIRAEAGLRHIAQGYALVLNSVARQGRSGAVSGFTQSVAGLRTLLPHDPFLELLPNEHDPGTVRVTPEMCERIGRLITDRPDFLSDSDWTNTSACIGQPALHSVGRNGWERLAVAGTGLAASGPWHVGPAVETPEYFEAMARAPWDLGQTWAATQRKANNAPSEEEILSVYFRVLEYNANAINAVLPQIEDPETIQRLAERVCAMEADACAEAGRRLSGVGRHEQAMPLGKRAVESAREPIRLSGAISWYVSQLQESGRMAEAMRIARRMADVYSGGGLATLAKAHERLGQFKEAATVYHAITERYGQTWEEDHFYIRHAQRQGAAPFEDETRRATARVFPNGLRKISIDQAAQATRPLSLNSWTLFNSAYRRLGLTPHDYFVALDGFIVETEAQFSLVASFTDNPEYAFLVKHGDGKVEEIKALLNRSHFNVVH